MSQMFKKLQSQLTSGVDSVKVNFGEGVDILKSVVTEIKNDLSAAEEGSLSNIFTHLARFVLFLVNEVVSNIRAYIKLQQAHAPKMFKLKVC